MNINYPKKPALRLSSIEEQTQKINAAALELVEKANAEFSGTRTVTKKAALTVISRSLAKNESDAFSVRKHKALTELSHYITLAQSNRALTASVENTDLLPIAHPRSTRDNDMTLASLMQHRARWIIDDPEIQDDKARTLLASALTSHPASVEYEYAITHLSTMPQGMVPQYALLAALGDGNSSAARRARAMLQRRDRKGRFAEMGGGLRALIKRAANGLVQSLTGTAVSQGIDGDTFDMELPDGKLVRVPASSAEAIKAILPSMQTKDGYSKTPAKVSIGDPVINEADLEVVDAPDGFKLDETWSPSADDVDYYGTKIDLGKKFTDDAYDVIKFDVANASAKDKFEAAQQKEAEGQNIVTVGKGKNNWVDETKPVYFVSRRDGKDKTFAAVQSWADVQDFITQDEPKYDKGEGVDPSKSETKKELLKKVKTGIEKVAEKKAAEEAKAEKPVAKLPEKQEDFDYPEGSYKLKQGVEYTPEGPIDGQVSPDYTDDPAELAQKFETDELVEALTQSVTGTKKSPATGFGGLPFEAGDEIVPAEAIYNALKEKGEDADSILGDIYSGGKQAEISEATPEVSDEIKDALGDEDVLDAPLPNGEEDPATLPPLLEGLSEDEKANYAETGDYTKYLPKNSTDEAPSGYTELNEDPFNNSEAVLPEDAPEGFSFNPVDIANSYNKEDLKGELRRALEPGNEMPGYGLISQETPEGEDYVGYVPGEAIRDALQLQGEDTNALINEIYAEGADNEPTSQETQDALEGEAPETTQGTPTEQEAPAESTEQTPSNEAGPEATTVNTGEPTGPARLKAKVSELKAGDVTTNDFFTIENIYSDADSESAKPGSVWVEGYYPGHATQKTKLWYPDTEIEVYRNVDAPQKGDLPELSKPFAKDYDPQKKVYKDEALGIFVPKDAAAREQYLADVEEYNKNLEAAKAMWSAPEGLEEWQTPDAAPVYTPENPIGISEVASVDVKPGDITFKKEWGQDYYEFFVVEGVSTDEEGNAVVQGYYPGHESQTKTWKGTTKITVIKGATPPEAGTKPALERPKKDDPDFAEKKAAFDAAKKESAATWTAPIDLEASAPQPKAKKPTPPAFQGDKLKAIAEAAGGDAKKFKELLAQEEVVHIDFESTGGFNKPSPIQVALVKTKNGEVIDSKVLFMNPEKPLDSFYTDKDPAEVLKDSEGNPISDAFLEKQMSQEDAFKQIMEFMGENPIVSAHNLPFDGEILKRYTDQFGMDYKPAGEIDTLSLARKVINGGNGDHVLQAVAARYDLAGPDTDWHDASVDVAVLPGILDNLLDEMAITNSGIDSLDVDKAKVDFDAANAQYTASKSKKAKADTELVMAKAFADGMAGKDVPTSEELGSALPKELPTSDELSPATTPKPSEVSDNDSQIESVLGGLVSNNWVSENENTTNVGKIAVEDMKPGDFISAQFGGYHEIISVEPDPDNDKKMVVTRRLLANGKEYKSSWIKYQAYEVRRRNEPIEIAQPVDSTPETPEVEQPILETDEAPEKESSAGTWNGYNIAQGTDGVYYAENISSTDVQALRNGQLTPPQLPFFAPLGGGNDQETGEGYFFSVNGKRFWGKYGAAGALVRRKNSDGVYEYFLAKRSSGLSQEGGKWGFPGGAHKDQTIAKSVGGTAKEEFSEEVGGDLSSLEPKYIHQNFVGPEWAYDTYVFEVGPKQLSDLTPKDGENSEIGWFTADQINQMAADGKLHTNFADSAQAIFDLSEDNTKGPEKPTPAESKSTEVKAFDTTNWKKIAGQAGSNEGAFYVDPDTGEQYYVKKPKSDKHAANEALASALYAEAGTKIGRVYLGKDSKGNIVLVSPLVENSNKDFADKKNDANILKSAQEDFAVDAWLNNYDSVGLAYDNMLTVDGDVYRVDPGGSLLFRAQGKDKSKELTDDVKSIDTLRDGSINSESNDIFGSMTDEQIAESAKKVQAISPEKIDQLVDQAFPDDAETASFLKEKLKARREDLINRFGLEPQEEEASEPVQSVSDSNPVIPLDPSGDLAQQLNDAVGKKVSFLYNGKDRVATVIPSKEGTAQIWENPKNGKTNIRLLDSDGAVKNFTISSIESNSEGFEAPKEASKPSTEAPSGWTKEGNYTWKKDGWVVTEDTEGNLTASNPKVSGLIFGNSWDEVQTKIDAEDVTPSIPQVATPEEIKAIAESPDGGITPSANDNIEPLNPVDTPLTETEKSTSLSEAEKQKVLDEVSNLAEKLFGSKGKTKDLLEALKGQEGVDSDLIDSIISDIDAPKTAPDATPEEKITSDLTQSLTPEDGDEDVPAEVLESITTEELAAEAKTPMDPDLIWKKVQEEYSSTTLPNGHIVVFSQTNGTDKFDVVVKRNSDNTFSVYHRITGPDGTSKVKNLKGRWHSFTALKSRIESEKWKAKVTPSKVKAKAKTETPGSILPAAIPTQKGSYVSADGVSIVKVGQKVKDVKTGKTGVVISLKDELITGKSKLKPEGYTYTDVAKIKWDDTGKKNWKVSTYLEILDGPSGGGSGGTKTTPTPTPSSPSTPSTPEVDATPAEIPTYDAPSLQGAKALKDVEALAAKKNENEHMSYFGADSYSDYKEFLKGDFVKDPESKNLVPGIIVSNASTNANDQDLTSHGVITKTNSKTGEVEVTYFDGPLAGKGQTLKSDKVWSREKFLTVEQSKELGIDVDTTLLEKSRAASKAKGEKYAKELAEKKKKAQQEAEAKALKSKFEVNGPGFALQTPNAPADWSKSPVDNAPSLADALKVAKGDNPLEAAKGATVLADSDAIEDLELRVQKVTAKGGKESIRVTFTLTDWAANPRVAEMIDDASIDKSSGLDIDKWEKQPDGSLKYSKKWDSSSVDQSGTGVTYSGKAGKGTFKLHRAKKGAEKANFFNHASNSSNSVAFHNKVEIILPANATEKDIEDAIKAMGGVDSVRPATKEDIKGLVENKMIWLYGRSTDGTKNYAGELRDKILQQIKDDYGFTADDVEIVVDKEGRGRISYLAPQSVADKIASETKINYFNHTWQSSTPNGTDAMADFLFEIFQSGGLYSTTNRWMDGININGMSSKADVKANGGNYMFTHQSSSPSSGSSLSFSFDARKLLRRMDFYKNGGDKYGQLVSDAEDVIEKLKSGGGEIMWKKNLSWADLSSVSMSDAVRAALVKKLLAAGLPEYAQIVKGK